MTATLGEAKEMLRNMISRPEARAQARDIAVRAIQKNPGDAELRLMLAKLYYLDGLFEFSARELIEVQFIQPTPSVEKLLDQFGEYSAPYLSRLKSLPRAANSGASAARLTAVPIGNPGQPAEAQAQTSDEVVAGLDVDLDLFEETE